MHIPMAFSILINPFVRPQLQHLQLCQMELDYQRAGALQFATQHSSNPLTDVSMMHSLELAGKEGCIEAQYV